MEQQLRSFDGQGNMIRTGRDCVGETGVVSAGRAEAAAIGRDILAQGGNAIDAAVATAFALGVCEPNASGLGGGGFMLLRDGKTGKSVFLDFRETAPQAAAPDMYTPKAPGSNVDIRERNVYGGMSAATPGEAAGLFYALEHYGTMTPAQVIAPAARLAREGYVVTPMLHGDMEAHKDHLRQYGAGWKIYLKDGEPFAVGDTVKNPDLANTLEKLAAGGKDAFYKGEIAEKMLAAVQADGGVLSQADLDGFSVRVLEPVRGTYRGYEILSSPPPSSGGTHVIEILNVLENFDVGAMEVNSAEYLHLFSEACKLCYADRAKYMGDPKFVKVPLAGLLSKDYARTLAEKIDRKQAHAPEYGDPLPYESMSTTHVSIADREGNLVAMTRTINHFFGSSLVPEGLGFLLNDEMEDFSIDPTSANAVAGGKIPLSCMSPTFILKDGKPVAVLGSPGGIRIISSVAQVISKLIDHKMTLEEAVSSPRMGDDQTDEIILEGRIPESTRETLRQMGHRVKVYDDWHRIVGAVNSVMFLPDGRLCGMGDPRRDGFALGR